MPARVATVPDRSLDDFLDDGGGDDVSDASADPDDAADAPADDVSDVADPDDADHEPAVDPATVDPLTPTLRFDPAGADCAACGATVERRWTDADGRPVCADCKAWDG